MTEPIRIDALSADDRFLDTLASRSYDGADPVGVMLLSFAKACDGPSPSARVRTARRSARRVVVSAFATAAFFASGAGVAAAVSDRLPDNPIVSWAAELREWIGVPGASEAPSLAAAPEAGSVARSTASTTPATRPGSSSSAELEASAEALVPVVPAPTQGGGSDSTTAAGAAAGATAGAAAGAAPGGTAGAGAGASAPSTSSPTPGPVTVPESTATPPVVAEAAPGKSGSAPGRTVGPNDNAATPDPPTGPRDNRGKGGSSDVTLGDPKGLAGGAPVARSAR